MKKATRKNLLSYALIFLAFSLLTSCNLSNTQDEIPEESESAYEVTEPEVTEPEVTEPEETEPEATEPEATEPEATEPEATEPEATDPEATEPKATEPEATEPEATEPEATEPEATEPEATEPEATEPEATEPKATEPEATEPEVTEPEATEPEATEPEATEPEVSEPKETDHEEICQKRTIYEHLGYYDGIVVRWGSIEDNDSVFSDLQIPPAYERDVKNLVKVNVEVLDVMRVLHGEANTLSSLDEIFLPREYLKHVTEGEEAFIVPLHFIAKTKSNEDVSIAFIENPVFDNQPAPIFRFVDGRILIDEEQMIKIGTSGGYAMQYLRNVYKANSELEVHGVDEQYHFRSGMTVEELEQFYRQAWRLSPYAHPRDEAAFGDGSTETESQVS